MAELQEAAEITLSSVHLNAIRGAAALIVLLGHTRNLFFSPFSVGSQHAAVQPLNSQGLTPGTEKGVSIGNEAVMIFFVLSGYLVGGSVLKAFKRNTWSWKNYFAKRMTRLWVVLIPALMLGVALDYVGLHFVAQPGSVYTGAPQQVLVQKDIGSRLSVPVILGNVVFVQGVLVSTAGTNASLWSLTNEFWYYLAFPVLLLTLQRRQKLWVRSVYLLALVSMALFVGRSISLLFFVWLLGALLSAVPLKVPEKLVKLLSVLMIVLLPVVLLVVKRASLPVYASDWIVAGLFTATLYLLLHQTGKAPKGIYRSTSDFFSRISYTLYLVHLPLAVLICACLNKPWHLWPKSPYNLGLFLCLNLVLIAVSYVIYLAFEARTDQVRNALFPRERAAVTRSTEFSQTVNS